MPPAYQSPDLFRNARRRCVEIAAPAKVNLFLEVLGRRIDGYHELETVMTTVSLYDQIRLIEREDDEVRLVLANPRFSQGSVPLDQQNLALKAVLALRKLFVDNRLPGCDILLYKRIPSEAGLGGASSDAAAALLAGRLLWSLKITDSDLMSLAAELGSDVPFFISGGTAMCRGRGERVELLPAISGIPLVIAKPTVGLSTREVFSRLNLLSQPRSSPSFLSHLLAGPSERVGKYLFNRLSETAVSLSPEIAHLAAQFHQTESLGHQMSGSGSSYFGIYRSPRAARRAARLLSNRLPRTTIYVTHTLGPNKSSHQ
jgi:4-diphosphocytidyl-2-C-methyl-D-erythritol kinase